MEIKGAVVLITAHRRVLESQPHAAASQAGARVILLARREDRIRKLAATLGDA